MHKDQFYKKDKSNIYFVWGLLNAASITDCMALHSRMFDKWITKDLDGCGHDPTGVLFQHLPGGHEENHKNTQLVHSQLPNHDSNQALSQIKVWGV